MSNGQWMVVLRHVQRLFHGESVSGLTEGQLLDRFISAHDEVAFGAIVARHGPMVLGICRSVLDDPHDVEDAFQATFLVLVRKATGLRDRDSLSSWLYGVARRVALRARSDSSRRMAREKPAIEGADRPVVTLDAELRELQFLVREEVDRLPGQDRMAVVLCYLEGLTHEEAADRLGWPLGTVKGRLSRGRERLRTRLTRRGIALPAVFVSTISASASASVSARLIDSTILAATRLAAGTTLTAGIVSAHAIALMEGVIGTMFSTKLKFGAMALVATGAFTVPGVMAWQGGSSSPARNSSKMEPNRLEVNEKSVSKAVSTTGTAIGAQAAKGALIQEADQALQVLDQLRAKGEAASSETYYTWSRRLLDAQTGQNSTREEKIKALESYVERTKKLKDEAVARQMAKTGTLLDFLDAEYRFNEAQKWLADAQAEPETSQRAMGRTVGSMGMGMGGMGGGGFGMAGMMGRNPRPEPDPDEEKRNKAIQAKLNEPLSMTFPNETPFEDVKKYIEAATKDEKAGFPEGIPIYIDPNGLKIAEKTMATSVTLNLQNIPLRTTLKLILSQIDLVYRVEDGVLIITNAYPKQAGGFQ